jgi:hypothetical protein
MKNFSWLFLVNYIFLQWFFVRLARITERGVFVKWSVLTGVQPLTGWNSPFKFINRKNLKEDKPLSREEFAKVLMRFSKTKLIKELVRLSQAINGNKDDITDKDKKEFKGYSQRKLVDAIMLLAFYMSNSTLVKGLKDATC